ncbi:MAG: hypothetical protein IJM59_11965 [Proteobacteria bacterium]|nr:hypothetical protein [Pseudomonadota bacterium]
MADQEVLREDLLSLEPKDFYMKHIVKSHNWYFSDYLRFSHDEIVDKMDYFKEIVSTMLSVNFHNVQIVGSAKVGYSLSPSKLFSPFHDECPDKPSSDIDIAIISERLYKKFWDELRQAKKIRYKQTYYNHLTKSIFRGYINEKDLMKVDGMCDEWEGLIRPINVVLQDTLGFVHPITYRVYRSWEDLEEYQLIGISKAKKYLEEH